MSTVFITAKLAIRKEVEALRQDEVPQDPEQKFRVHFRTVLQVMAIIEAFPQLEGRSKENLCVEMVRVVLGFDIDEALLRCLIAEAINISKGEYKLNASSWLAAFKGCFGPKKETV